MSNLLKLHERGQSVWLDYIDRNLLVNGGLARLVESGLRGVTSNPTIFHKAITGGSHYDGAIRDLLQADHEMDAATLYEWLSLQDIQMAADLLRPVYDGSGGADGFVSLEVSPHLARDTGGTVRAARHLWGAVHRPNLMVKVPGTAEGLPAIEQLVADGINVNVTLLFSVDRYVEVAHAYLRGLAHNDDPGAVASVASFFVSRVDRKVDAALEKAGGEQALRLRGRIAVANAKDAYRRFGEIRQSAEWKAQEERGARPQRPLWASTSTKNPAYSDVLYVEELIGPHTVNTVPPDTLDAVQDHLAIRDTLTLDVHAALEDIARLADLGIDLDAVTRTLEDEGIAAFADSNDRLVAALDAKRAEVMRNYVGAD